MQKNSFGLVISDATEIRDKIQSVDYSKMVNNVMKNRQNFTVKYNINRMIEFMEECNKQKEVKKC